MWEVGSGSGSGNGRVGRSQESEWLLMMIEGGMSNDDGGLI